jgi:hypothetical protein
MTQEYDDPPADVERSATPDESSDDAPQFYNDAHDVYGKIFSTNFGILCAGFNGTPSFEPLQPQVLVSSLTIEVP